MWKREGKIELQRKYSEKLQRNIGEKTAVGDEMETETEGDKDDKEVKGFKVDPFYVFHNQISKDE